MYVALGSLPVPAASVTVQVTVPVFVLAGSMSTGIILVHGAKAGSLPLSRFTNFTRAFLISPAFGSVVGSIAVMSLIVARRVTLPLVAVAVAVLAKSVP